MIYDFYDPEVPSTFTERGHAAARTQAARGDKGMGGVDAAEPEQERWAKTKDMVGFLILRDLCTGVGSLFWCRFTSVDSYK